MPEVKYMNIHDFREIGFLQEANRLFFHPLGLALEVKIEEDGSEHLTGVWDYRDDDEGMIFSDDMLNNEESRKKAKNVQDELARHREARVMLLGDVVQKIKET